MYVEEPLYYYIAHAGKSAWLYMAFATWLLGFATFQALYAMYLTAPVSALPQGLPGPDSFASVVIGDCFILPAINALAVAFYDACRKLDFVNDTDSHFSSFRLFTFAQSTFSLLIGTVTTLGTYAWWFYEKKVDWTLPFPGKPNAGGYYHAVFMLVEIYILVNFSITACRLFLYMIRAPEDGASKPNLNAQPPFLLTRLVGGIFLGVGIFNFALLVDVLRGTIPIATYVGAVIAGLVSMVILTSLSASGLRRKYRISIPRDTATVLLNIAAWLVLIGPLIYMYLDHNLK